MSNSLKIRDKGSTLLEIVIYIFIFTFLAAAVTNALQSLIRSYTLIQSSGTLEFVAHTALERMTRDVRDSKSINLATSVLGTSPGVLVLNSTDDDDNDMTIEFFISSGVIRVKENNVDIGPISSNKATITRLIFTSVTTPNSKGVKLELTAESGNGSSYKSESFYTSAVLRGSYAP